MWLTACGANPPAETGESEVAVVDPAPGDPEYDAAFRGAPVPYDPVAMAHCAPPDTAAEDEPLLDKTQKRVYQVVYHSTRWFDGLFGSSSISCAGNVSRGYVGGGMRWDERDGGKGRFRFKAKIALPALSDKTRLVVGRVDPDNFVDGTEDSNIDSLPSRFNDLGDQEFVLGLGYANTEGIRKGWDFGVGIRLRTPIEPYTKLSYHWNPLIGERWLWRVKPQLFWQENRGAGASVTNIVDFAVSDRWMLRSWSIAVEEDEAEGLAWTSKFTAYQSLSELSAMAYSVYANGETEADVDPLDYGVELRYRRSVFRPWFFVEFLSSLSWPRELPEEKRESNIGVGIEFNMLFGDEMRGN